MTAGYWCQIWVDTRLAGTDAEHTTYRCSVTHTDELGRVEFVAVSPFAVTDRDSALRLARVYATRHRDRRHHPWGDRDGSPVPVEPAYPTSAAS